MSQQLLSGSQQLKQNKGNIIRSPEQQAATPSSQQQVFSAQGPMLANMTLGQQYTSPISYTTQYPQQTTTQGQPLPISTYLPSAQPINIPAQPISGQVFSGQQQPTYPQQMAGGVVKGESRIEYFPYQREYIEYVTQEVIEYVPRERKITEYYTVQFDIEYIPQVFQEKYYEYVPVEQIRERVEYQAVQKQTVLSGPTTEIPKTNEYNIQTSLPTRTTLPSNQSQPNQVPQSYISYIPQYQQNYEVAQAAPSQQNQVYMPPPSYYQPQTQPVSFIAQPNQQIQPEEQTQYVEQPIQVITQPSTYQSTQQFQPMVASTQYQPVTAKSVYSPSYPLSTQQTHQFSQIYQPSPLKSSQQVKAQPRQ